jgi:hypothetical protein
MVAVPRVPRTVWRSSQLASLAGTTAIGASASCGFTAGALDDVIAVEL